MMAAWVLAACGSTALAPQPAPLKAPPKPVQSRSSKFGRLPDKPLLVEGVRLDGAMKERIRGIVQLGDSACETAIVGVMSEIVKVQESVRDTDTVVALRLSVPMWSSMPECNAFAQGLTTTPGRAGSHGP